SSYVSVDVEADMEDVAWTDGQAVHSTVKTKTSAALGSVLPDAYYWERNSTDYRYYLHADVPRAELARMRAEKTSARRSATGLEVIALLPFRGTGASTAAVDLIARGLFDETARVLSRSAGVHVVDEPTMRSLGDDTERLRAALSPDWIVRTSIQQHRDR